ncbi:hypothetical protein BDZ89DRAFT_776754 [Hymenopellis radicata]|nr:hypothetical protein BDZ89DRAFT_776754 [Hymenopellis radicata]
MLGNVFAFVTLFSCLSVALAQNNITVNDTDSAITYENAGDALICKFDSNGTIIGGQAGCYNVLPSNCTDSVAMSQANNASASFKFKGSAIYINSLQFMFSPLYTVTLDGASTDVDGWVDDNFFTCARPLFSQTGLDPGVEHEVRLATKGASPSNNESGSDAFGIFSLVSFVGMVVLIARLRLLEAPQMRHRHLHPLITERQIIWCLISRRFSLWCLRLASQRFGRWRSMFLH